VRRYGRPGRVLSDGTVPRRARPDVRRAPPARFVRRDNSHCPGSFEGWVSDSSPWQLRRPLRVGTASARHPSGYDWFCRPPIRDNADERLHEDPPPRRGRAKARSADQLLTPRPSGRRRDTRTRRWTDRAPEPPAHVEAVAAQVFLALGVGHEVDHLRRSTGHETSAVRQDVLRRRISCA